MKQTFLHGWKQIALLLVFPLMAEGAGAQERITLGECYEWAHANYPQIRQYGLIEQTERYNLSNAAKGWMPQLSVNAKATYQSDVTKLPFDADKLSAIIPGIEIPTLSKDQYQVVAEVNQTIWDGGVIRSTRQLTEAQATADREQLNSDLYTLNDRVNQLYFGCLLQDELIRQNRMAGGHAVYALEDRVERLCNLAFDASFATEADARLTLRYGVSLRRENTRSYKQMRDLLGAGYVTDIDRFLIDDDTYSNLLQNDLRHPGRTVREGDRFGYDYALTLRGAALRLQADYRSDRHRCGTPRRQFPGRSFGRAGERCRQPPGLLREGTFSRRAVLRPFARHAVHALHAQGRCGLGLLPAPLYRNRRRGRRPDPSGRGPFLSAAL